MDSNWNGNALKAVQEGKISMRKAATTFGVTYTILNKKITDK